MIYDPKRNNGRLHKLSFPLDSPEDPIISVDELNAKLEALVATHPSVTVRQNCERWNKRSIVLQLDDLAVFHVFLTWQSESVVTFGRINVIGVKEEVSLALLIAL